MWRLLVELERPLVNVLVVEQRGAEAERIARTMLDRLERNLGPDHPERINALTRLANALVAQLRYPEAVAVGADAVERSRRIFGASHPLTADALHAEVLALERLGRYPEAMAAENEAVTIARGALGEDHPRTIAYLFNLAILTRNTGDPEGALPMLRHVVEVRTRILGESSADTIQSLRSLNLLLVGLGRPADAREVAQRTIRAFDGAVAVPDADPNLVGQFAAFLLDVRPEELQDPPRALTLAERAVASTDRKLYPSLRTLGDALDRAGRTDEAIATYREVLALPEGMRSWSTEDRVVALLRANGRPEDVESFLNDRLASQRAQPQPDERMIAKTMRQLALHHTAQGQQVEAERSFRDAFEILSRVLPADNWELGRIESELGGCVAIRKAFAEAEPLLLEGHRILAGDRQATSATAAARKRLEDLYEAWGRPAEAKRWRAAP
jgi:tetratricopeptide (TPR) repeat protein